MVHSAASRLSATRSRTGFVLKLLVPAILLSLLVWQIDISEVLRVLANPEFWPFVIAMIVAPLGQFVSARKWQLLVNAQGMSLRFGHAVRLYFIGGFAGLYLPTNFGGDALRLYLARRLGPVEYVAASIVTERVTGVAMLLIFAFLGLILGPAEAVALQGLQFAWLIALVLAPLALLAIFRPLSIIRPVCYLGLRHLGRIGAKIEEKSLQTATAMDRYKRQPRTLVHTLCWSFIFYVNVILSQYFHLNIVSADISIFGVLLIAPMITLISLVPVSINGIGLAESAFVIGYMALGLSPEVALAAALIRRVFYSVVLLPGLFFWIQDKDVPLKPVRAA